jgi:hypothetical protein
MRIPAIAALLSATALTVAMTLPADAAKRRSNVISYGNPDHELQPRRAPTRLTVKRRSFLDPGTQVRPGDEKYQDYAFPPGYSPIVDKTNYNFTADRMPLPSRWDIPGWPKF